MNIFIHPEPVEEVVRWWQAPSGILGVIVAAIVAGIVATAQIRHQRKMEEHRERRKATAGLIQAIHDLSQQSKDASRNNELDRNRMYQQSVLFELAAGNKIDQKRFNYAINWILKASRLRFDYAVAEEKRETVVAAHEKFVDSLVLRMTQSLRDFELKNGSFDLTGSLAKKFGFCYHSAQRHLDPEISRIFTEAKNIYKGLTGKEPHTSDSPESETKPY